MTQTFQSGPFTVYIYSDDIGRPNGVEIRENDRTAYQFDKEPNYE
jgi:hypothetical protein